MRLTLLFAALLSTLSVFAQVTDDSYPASEPNLQKVRPTKEAQSLEEQQQQLEEQQRMEEKENKKIEAINKQKEELFEQETIDNSIPSSTPP